jgi:hypothetical protein
LEEYSRNPRMGGTFEEYWRNPHAGGKIGRGMLALEEYWGNPRIGRILGEPSEEYLRNPRVGGIVRDSLLGSRNHKFHPLRWVLRGNFTRAPQRCIYHSETRVTSSA